MYNNVWILQEIENRYTLYNHEHSTKVSQAMVAMEGAKAKTIHSRCKSSGPIHYHFSTFVLRREKKSWNATGLNISSSWQTCWWYISRGWGINQVEVDFWLSWNTFCAWITRSPFKAIHLLHMKLFKNSYTNDLSW